ncbi:bifunctional glutamate N-acetyltransferase/amino-acid acetyltransferase ArgJ [Ruminococcaceae bacterium OttesenSCG-928-A16]|nr:bifunctional glutamate N-acetyltransferase/amino-acid acetyltransferase ArgJ [Ruminococcaceae bacterium OttesenSCG-928-A16]
MTTIPGGVCAPQGFLASGVHCGIRHNKDKLDLALIMSEVQCSAAAVYTQNKVQGAPIGVTKNNIAGGKAHGILCNSGNANTCNPNGTQVAKECCALAAKATGLAPQDFIVASTGVIGQPLALAPFVSGIPKAAAALTKTGSNAAATAIITTDTVVKETAVEFTLGGKTCRMGAIGKGSGMIHPNMATMLIFITTDVAISPALLQKALAEITVTTYNQISVDGDTSTNDMVAVLANGLAGNANVQEDSAEYQTFYQALHSICLYMSRAIAADGEGATKLLECKVTGAPTDEIARAVAKNIISSSLFKAAMFGADANWGRALCAIGYTPGNFSIDTVSVTLQSSGGSVMVCKNAAYNPYSEQEAAAVLAKKTIEILVDMGTGSGSGEAWGCDLTYDYVKINGDYRT